jgi:hypothetical protein
MSALDQLAIQRQPNDTTCGPTCLQAVYRYFGEDLPLSQVISETRELRDGGTLGVCLGAHALSRGYRATIFTFNLQVFDPSWFQRGVDLSDKLTQQYKRKGGVKLREATSAYLEFLDFDGEVRFTDLTTELLTHYLERDTPVLTGLSATYLHQSRRESAVTRTNGGPSTVADDIGGLPVGHFVVLCGWLPETSEVRIADPWQPSPLSDSSHYWVRVDRLKSSILLGVLTYDANLLVIEPPRE